jgi:hypothetical protein
MSDYTFFNLGRIGSEEIDNTQRQVLNMRFANYNLSNYFSDPADNNHVNFATAYPQMLFSATNGGNGLSGAAVDADSKLLIQKEQTRSLDKLNLNTRPFITVPYLGRGSCDTLLETQLLQGELRTDKKSVSTIMDKSFMEYSMYPTDQKMEERVQNPAYNVEEAALDGWVRGGVLTRQMANDQHYSQNARPSTMF